MAFAPDSRLLALTRNAHTVQLADPASGRELATLTAPEQHTINWLCFNHDATQLAASTPDHVVQLWDLRLLRERLAEMGLDWDRPLLPSPDGAASRPIQVKLESGEAVWPKPAAHTQSLQEAVAIASVVLDLSPFNFYAYQHRGDAYTLLGKTRKALDDYSRALACMPLEQPRRAAVLWARAALFERRGEFAQARTDLEKILELVPDDADACNSLAWLLATGPETLRDLPRALHLAQKAVKLTPGEWTYLNTLGVASYRLGQYPQAIEHLQRSYRASKGEYAAYDLFFLAMCYARIGAAARAKECYDGALGWIKNQQGRLSAQAMEALNRELNPICSEAAALLQKNGKPF